MLKAIRKDLLTMKGLVFDTYEAKPLKKDDPTIEFIDFLIDRAPEINLFGNRYNYEDVIFSGYKADEIEEIKSDNSYNWAGPITFQYRVFTYRGREYTAINFHRFGDVRGNYTKYAILDCTQQEFYDLISEFCYNIPAADGWEVIQDIYSESGYVNAWNNETDEEFSGYYEASDAPEAVRKAVSTWLGWE